jgi:hypothetical protein
MIKTPAKGALAGAEVLMTSERPIEYLARYSHGQLTLDERGQTVNEGMVQIPCGPVFLIAHFKASGQLAVEITLHKAVEGADGIMVATG